MPDTTPHTSFELLRERDLPSLRVHIAEYRHRRTGAEHLHLSRDSDENVFLVALRTVPQDSTGVAHILEHTTLCGSARFPVRDPFFMMLRRSLSTFMNAMTSSDWTAYPFSTLNRKDFDNLLQVYLDAVFFPKLHELDFAQEGHRLEFTDPADPNSPLQWKGVVYNEMKGAMSAPSTLLYHHLAEQLFPTTTYHYNSGGDPARIPSLEHAQLVDFHRQHYHPSNAIFATCGNISAAEQQRRFEELALNAFEASPSGAVTIPDERRYDQPQQITTRYPVSESDGLSGKTHIVLGWLLGNSADLKEQLHARLLSNLLLSNSASPLCHALETTDLGAAMSPLSGLEDGCREMFFACGVEGSEPEHADAVEALVLETLERVAKDGVPEEDIAATLHQIELHQREISGDHYPYGLQLVMSCLEASVHQGDPIARLDQDAALAQLRDAAQDPDFVPQLAQRMLLDNPHRVRLTMAPDAQLAERTREDDVARLRQIQQAMSEERQRDIIAQTDALARRQAVEDDPNVLPCLTLSDIPQQPQDPSFRLHGSGQLPTHCYPQGTNGLAYQHMVVKMPMLDEREIDLLPVYASVLSEVGCAGKSYLDTQKRQALLCGHLYCSYHWTPAVDDVQRVSAYVTLQGNALRRNAGALDALIHDTLHAVRLDELPRLRDLVAQMRARAEHRVTSNGHRLAMLAAISNMSPIANLQHRVSGLPGIRQLRELDDRINDPANCAALAEQLAQLHRKVLGMPMRALLIGEDDMLDDCCASMLSRWERGEDAPAGAAFSRQPLRTLARQYWQTTTMVNFCARSWPTVPHTHPDAPALSVLGHFLRNGYLHRAIREQGGAYGAGAAQNGAVAAFTCYSYRDPRLLETLDVFDGALAWLLDNPHEDRQVDEAILGLIGGMDKPPSPAGEASQHFFNELHGHHAALRRDFRHSVLETRLADLQRVGQRYLGEVGQASGAVLTANGNAAKDRCADWEQETL